MKIKNARAHGIHECSSKGLQSQSSFEKNNLTPELLKDFI
jgi:hypothetical protein